MSGKELMAIRFDSAGIRRLLDLGDEIATKSAITALNRSVGKARTFAVRRVSADLQIAPQKIVRKRTKIWKASLKSARAGLGLIVRPIRTAALAGVRQSAQGVTATGGRSFSRAFLAHGYGGYLMVFRRRTKERYPIYEKGVSDFEIRNEADKDMKAALEYGMTQVEGFMAHELAWRMGATRRK